MDASNLQHELLLLRCVWGDQNSITTEARMNVSKREFEPRRSFAFAEIRRDQSRPEQNRAERVLDTTEARSSTGVWLHVHAYCTSITE